jgi:peptidyl-prolyl cis-trans isomerase SurA
MDLESRGEEIMKRMIAGAVLVVTAGWAAPLLARQGLILEQIVVKVNGDIFTKTDLEQRQITTLRDQNKLVRASKDLSDAALKPILAEITPQILVDAVDELLIVQRGRELGYRLADDRFKDIVAGIKKDNKFTSDEQFQAAVRQEGMTMAEFRDRLERNFIVHQVQQQEVMQRVSLTEQEGREYYKTHQPEFLKPSTIVVREILMSVPTQTQGGQQVVNAGIADDVKDKINAIRARALKGEDFTALVKEASESPSKANGGLVPPINEADLAPEVRAVFDKLQVGDITEPLLTVKGYSIFKLDSRTPAVVEDFEKVRDQILDKVSGERMDVETKKYIEKLRAQAIIEWKNDDFKKLYDQKLAARGGH